MTHKQFKQILTDAGIEIDYALILIQMERLAWIESKEYRDMGVDYIANLEKQKASAIHSGLEAAGIYGEPEAEAREA